MSEENKFELQDILDEYSDYVPEPVRPEEEPKEELEEELEEEKRAPGADLFEWLQMLMVCVMGAIIAFNCVVRLSVVDGHSMDPTLSHGELMLVWALGYTPDQGDVIVLNKTTADFLGEAAIVKRVIATGGQVVDIDYEETQVYVDGEPLEED